MRRWVWLPLIVVAFALRGPGLDKPLWEDEGVTLQGFRSVEGLRFVDWLMPAALLHRLAAALVETGSLMAARLPYLLIGLAGVWLGWALGRTWRSWTLAFLLTSALAVWPFKLYWDTLAREYTLVLTLGMAAILIWERYRVRPSWRRYAVALGMTAAAALAHELALVMLLFPACYLAWDAWRTLRSRAGRTWITAGQWATRVSLAGLIAHGALCLALGSNYWRGLIVQNDMQPGTVTAIGAGAAGFSAFHGEEGHLPGLAEGASFVIENMAGALRPGGWSIAPLLGLERELPRTSGAFIFNQLTLDPRGIYKITRGGLLDSLLLGLLIAGVVGLLWRSPPLALALCLTVTATSALIFFNQKLRMPVDRYYTLAALACLILTVHGAWSLAAAIPWFLRRRLNSANRRRLRAVERRAVPAVCVLGMSLACLIYGSTGRALARHAPDDWRTFHDLMISMFPEGVFFNGVRAQQFEVYERLRCAQEGTSDNRVQDAIGFRFERDEQVFDRLNRVEGVAIFRPAYMADQPYAPVKRYRGLFEWKSWNQSGLIAEYAALGNKLFLMRGRLDADLLERMRDPQQESGYAMELYCEVPGNYTLHVITERENEIREARLDAVPLMMAVQTGDKASTWSTQITIDGDPMRARQFRLQFEKRPTAAPAISLQRAEEAWLSLTQGLQAAPIKIIRQDNGDYVLTTVLCVGRGMPMFTSCAARIGPIGGAPLLRWQDIVIDAPRRELHVGDMLWSGPLRITAAEARAWIGKPLAVELIPIELAAPREDPRYKMLAEGKLSPAEGAALITALPGKQMLKLRFAEMQGSVLFQVAE